MSLLICIYEVIYDAVLFKNIKLNRAETIGTVTFKIKGTGRGAQKVHFYYTVSGKYYESEQVGYGNDTVTFDDIVIPASYVVIYNKRNPNQCVLDVGQLIPDSE